MLNRWLVRARFVERFSVERMAGDYLALYRELASPDRSRRELAYR
jgi:glycosyltransferase involved in cell wall biosynthesis